MIENIYIYIGNINWAKRSICDRIDTVIYIVMHKH